MSITETPGGFTVKTTGVASAAPVVSSASTLAWRNADPTIRTGTACMCGAGTSAIFEKGGSAWLDAHVQAHHITGSQRIANMIATVITIPPLTDAQRSAIVAAIAAQGPADA